VHRSGHAPDSQAPDRPAGWRATAVGGMGTGRPAAGRQLRGNLGP